MSTIDSLKHTRTAQRSHTASQQEAGTESTPDRPAHDYPLNPITTRGQDPELFWMNKYGADNHETRLQVDIRSLYRYEHIAPEVLIQRLYRLKEAGPQQLDINALFGNALDLDELDKPGSYYKHSDGWTNRLIQGDNLLVMTSLLDREGMAGKVQMVYIDPPYGIKYGSNWQMRLNDRNVKDGDDASLTGEPEVIKAFCDTWELGIHSYLSYLRERLLVVRNLLTESGSCFVQISDENVHLVRCVMDEVFGSGNSVATICYKKPGQRSAQYINVLTDFILWYAKDRTQVKYRQLFIAKSLSGEGGDHYTQVESSNGTIKSFDLYD